MSLDFPEIKRRRESAGLTMEQAADRANEVFDQLGEKAAWSRQRWNDLESGRRPDLRVVTLQVIALVLGCREGDLLAPIAAALPRLQKRKRPSSDAGSNG